MITSLRIDEINLNDVNLIDIRTKEEVDAGMIKGALRACLEKREDFNADFFKKIISNQINPNKKIALICESGNRSMVMAKILDEIGMDVINVMGGMSYARMCDNIEII